MATKRAFGPDSYDGKYRAAHKEDNAQRKAARRKVEKVKGKAAVAGRDVNHKNGLAAGNGMKNLAVESVAKNRGRK